MTHYTTQKKLFSTVLLVTIFSITVSTLLIIWSGKKMNSMLTGQFNEQQLIIAKNVKHLIEKDLTFITSELSIFIQMFSTEDMVRIKPGDKTHQSLLRVFKNGVDKVEIIDPIKKQTVVITLNAL